MNYHCTCGCNRDYPESEIADLKVKRKLSRECLRRLRSIPRRAQHKPSTAIPGAIFRMVSL